MRLRGLMGLAALVVIAACSDAVGPPAEGHDLDFLAPTTGMASVLTDGETPEDPAEIPLISRKFVAGSWYDYTYTIAYGMFGGGTGYTMRPHVRIVDGDGHVALDRDGVGLSEDAPLYWYMRPTGIEAFSVGFTCGGFGEVTVNFEARMSAYGLTPTLLRTQQNDFAHTPQGMCVPPTTSTGGGSGPTGGRVTITVCDYEAWVTPDGTVIAVVELGCTTTVGETLAQ